MATGYAHITRTPGVCGGRPRIDGHRIRVQDIAIAFLRQALSVDEICDQYPDLTLAEVHSALSYYFDHQTEIDAEIEADRQMVEYFKHSHPEWTR